MEFYRKHLKLDNEDFNKFTDSLEMPPPSIIRISPTLHSQEIKDRLEEYKLLEKIKLLKDASHF